MSADLPITAIVENGVLIIRIPVLVQMVEIPRRLNEFTERETQIIRAIVRGIGNKQIASDLNISERTVKFHVSAVLEKTGLTSRTEIGLKFRNANGVL